jgi:hypothetical protein
VWEGSTLPVGRCRTFQKGGNRGMKGDGDRSRDAYGDLKVGTMIRVGDLRGFRKGDAGCARHGDAEWGAVSGAMCSADGVFMARGKRSPFDSKRRRAGGWNCRTAGAVMVRIGR